MIPPPPPGIAQVILAPFKAIRQDIPKVTDVLPEDVSPPPPEAIRTKIETTAEELTRPPKRIIEGAPRIEHIAGEIRGFETLPKPVEMLEIIPSPGDVFRHFPGPLRDVPPPTNFIKDLDRMLDDFHNNSQAIYEIMHARFPVAAKDWSDMAADAHEVRRDLHELNKVGMEFLREVGKALTKVVKSMGEGVPFIPGI